jgi:hypothetical protein
MYPRLRILKQYRSLFNYKLSCKIFVNSNSTTLKLQRHGGKCRYFPMASGSQEKEKYFEICDYFKQTKYDKYFESSLNYETIVLEYILSLLDESELNSAPEGPRGVTPPKHPHYVESKPLILAGRVRSLWCFAAVLVVSSKPLHADGSHTSLAANQWGAYQVGNADCSVLPRTK